MKYRKFTAFLLAMVMTLSVSGLSASAMEIGGVDVVTPINSVITYGSNVWHNNNSTGTATFPFGESYNPVLVGKTHGQPIMMDKYIFIQADGNITAILKASGKVIGTYKLTTASEDNSLFILKNSDNSYQLLAIDGSAVINLSVSASDSEVKFSEKWKYSCSDTGISSKCVNVCEDGNSAQSKKYVVFGTTSGKIITLYLDSGREVSNGVINTSAGMQGVAPIIYYNYDNKLSKTVTPGTINNKGIIEGTSIINGSQQEDVILNKGSSVSSSGLSEPSALTYVTNYLTGGSRPVVILQEGSGVILGFDPEKRTVLFRITKYSGGQLAGVSIKDSTVIATVNKDGTAHILSFDIIKAINAAQDNDDKGYTADNTVTFTEDLAGTSYTGTSTFSSVGSDYDSYGNERLTEYQEIFLTGDSSDNPSVSNLRMYYINKTDSKKPGKVNNAFAAGTSTSFGLYIKGSVMSKISCAGGYMCFVDGYGSLHVFSAVQQENLAVANFDNSDNILVRGGSYKAAVDVMNYSRKTFTDVPITFEIYDSKGTLMHTHNEKISFGADGCTVYLKYDIPMSYTDKELKIKVSLNMETGHKALDETTYVDNVATFTLGVIDSINLSVAGIKYDTFPANQRVTEIVTIKNSSNMALKNPLIPVIFTITYNGQTTTKEKDIEVHPSSMGLVQVPFTFSTPDDNTSFTITVKVNPNGAYRESDLSDNTKTITAHVSKNNSYQDNNVNQWNDTIITGYQTVYQ